MRVEVKPELLRWSCERIGSDIEGLSDRFPQLPAWERGERSPTLKQLERLAKATHTPVGYFFLPEPPQEQIPIPDFRTVANKRLLRPSPDLLETIYVCQQRQEWYRDFARSVGIEPLAFVGSETSASGVVATAARIRGALGFELEEQRRAPTWTDALRRFIELADDSGILVMISGIVGSNTRRKLDPDEFRGFALSDDVAPLIFINGADTRAAQVFTLAHEVAHLWRGESALSNIEPVSAPTQEVERWCNRVAAELLVPLSALKREHRREADLSDEINRLARCFKVSTLVVLRRIHDAGRITKRVLGRAYREELERLLAIPRGSGGNFYLTQTARVSKRFATALVSSTLEGQTLHRDASHLLGFSKLKTFRELGHRLGVI